MKQEIIFSIITVCLNDKLRVLKTSKSLEKQTFTNFEWIVIDGGSCDGTIDFLANNPWVDYFIAEPDKGIFDAMNKGIKQARGCYCLFLNAGDYLYEETVLEKVSKSLCTDLIVGEMYVVTPEKSSKKSSLRKFREQRIETEDYLYYKSLPHQATFIRKSLFSKFGNYDSSMRILGDHDFFARVLNKKATLSLIDSCISVYSLDGLSTQLKGSQTHLRELEIVRKRNFSALYRFKKRIVDLILNK